jgi:hypothetical protein
MSDYRMSDQRDNSPHLRQPAQMYLSGHTRPIACSLLLNTWLSIDQCRNQKAEEKMYLEWWFGIYQNEPRLHVGSGLNQSVHTTLEDERRTGISCCKPSCDRLWAKCLTNKIVLPKLGSRAGQRSTILTVTSGRLEGLLMV